METKVFSANSLIYRFLAYPRNYLSNPPSDICELTRAVLFRAFLVLLGALVIGTYVTSVPYYLYAGFVCDAFDIKTVDTLVCTVPYTGLIKGIYIAGGLLTLVTTIVAALCLLVALVVGCFHLGGIIKESIYERNAKRRRERENDPNYKAPVPRRNVLKEMYRSHKEKTCFRVTFQ